MKSRKIFNFLQQNDKNSATMPKPNPFEAMDFDNIPSLPNHNKSMHQQMAVNRPSNFSIEHILSSAGSTKEKFVLDYSKKRNDDVKPLYPDPTECYVVDNSVVHQYPPILNWLQYTRYKPPRLPSKLHTKEKSPSFLSTIWWAIKTNGTPKVVVM